MRSASEGVLIETDVLVDFLFSRGSLLRNVLSQAPCYTTVVNAAELFSAASNEQEHGAAYALLSGLRVMGLSARYAATIGEVSRQAREQGNTISERDAIIVGTAIAARLPIVTKQREEKYKQYDRVHVVSAGEFEELKRNSK